MLNIPTISKLHLAIEMKKLNKSEIDFSISDHIRPNMKKRGEILHFLRFKLTIERLISKQKLIFKIKL